MSTRFLFETKSIINEVRPAAVPQHVRGLLGLSGLIPKGQFAITRLRWVASYYTATFYLILDYGI